MNVEVKKYQLIEWITSIQDTKLINKLVKLAENSDWWEGTSESEKQSIERGMDDLSSNRFVNHAEAREVYEKYL